MKNSRVNYKITSQYDLISIQQHGRKLFQSDRLVQYETVHNGNSKHNKMNEKITHFMVQFPHQYLVIIK